MKSQNERILAHLRISQMVEVENERGERKRVARYWLLKEAK